MIGLLGKKRKKERKKKQTNSNNKRCRERIVDGVASLCATLNEYPYIRYQEGSVLGETLAKSLEERQENLIRKKFKKRIPSTCKY